MQANPEHLLVSTTLDEEPAAEALAHKIIEARLAACVQRMPIQSVYRWQGAVESAAEYLLLAKTTAARADALVAFVKANHSYEVPEITVAPIVGGLPAYLHWIDTETAE